MDFLFNNPYVPWILLAGGLFFVYQKFGHHLKIRVPGGGMTQDDMLGKVLGSGYAQAKLDKAVRKLKKQENWLAAGKLLEDADRVAEAAETYLEGHENWAAAATLEKMGKGEKAAELYLEAGDYKKAAALLISVGKPGKAATLFQEKGNNLEAARLYGLAGQWDKSAELYGKSGYPLRAAEAFEKQGQFVKAAEAYEKHFTENVSYSTSFSSSGQTGDQKSALLAGRLYEKAGDLNRAFQVYNKGSYFKEAAAALVKLGQHAKAAEVFMRAEDPQSAAAAYEKAGDLVKASNLRGEVAFRSDKAAEAAAHFVKGRDFLRAAELFESVGLLAEAAGAYEAGESWPAAGSVYIRAGLKDRAAAAYERGGEFETAAKLYEEAGNGRKATELFGKAGLTFKSGEAAAKAGERERAIALLQRVGASDENYRAATELLAQLFIESGMPALAVERAQKALAGQPVSASNLDLYYWLGRAQEYSGTGAEALATFGKIQAGRWLPESCAAAARRLPSALAAAVRRPGPRASRARPWQPSRAPLASVTGRPGNGSSARPWTSWRIGRVGPGARPGRVRRSRGQGAPLHPEGGDRARPPGHGLSRRGRGGQPQRRPSRPASGPHQGRRRPSRPGGRPEGGGFGVAPEPGQGARHGRGQGPALSGHRARGRQELR